MEPIRIKVTEADAIVTQAPTVTSGMTGLMAEFEFDAAWEGFTKTAVFKAGDVVRDVVDIGTSCKVPPEVLVLPYRTLRVGVYGVSEDAEVTIPTIWAAVDEIKPGADPSGDESTKPTLPVWQQILDRVNNCVKTVNGAAPDENGNVNVQSYVKVSAEAIVNEDGGLDLSNISHSATEIVGTISSGGMVVVTLYVPELDNVYVTTIVHVEFREVRIIIPTADGKLVVIGNANGGWQLKTY